MLKLSSFLQEGTRLSQSLSWPSWRFENKAMDHLSNTCSPLFISVGISKNYTKRVRTVGKCKLPASVLCQDLCQTPKGSFLLPMTNLSYTIYRNIKWSQVKQFTKALWDTVANASVACDWRSDLQIRMRMKSPSWTSMIKAIPKALSCQEEDGYKWRDNNHDRPPATWMKNGK